MLKPNKEYLFRSVPAWSICYYVFSNGRKAYFIKLPRYSHYGFTLHFNVFWLEPGEYSYFESTERVFYLRPVGDLKVGD